MQAVAFKAGDTIISEGDQGDTAFFIVSGSVEVSIGQGARARTLGALQAGEVFGEMCLIEPGRDRRRSRRRPTSNVSRRRMLISSPPSRTTRSARSGS